MFVADLFIIAQNWKNPDVLSPGERTVKQIVKL